MLIWIMLEMCLRRPKYKRIKMVKEKIVDDVLFKKEEAQEKVKEKEEEK